MRRAGPSQGFSSTCAGALLRGGARFARASPALEARRRIGYRRVVMVDEDTIAEAGRRLHEAAAPGSRVILFGSHARGEARTDSDLDFLVVEPEVEHAAAESVRLRRALRGLRLFADVVVVSERDVEEWREVRGSLVRSALTDGRMLAA
ncbi:nucleotidyltransferase domain-containing protein [Conexibacter arvalis]|nr:nucleotidyltransferase domain-containing protein [Conexibacter arvalis]